MRIILILFLLASLAIPGGFYWAQRQIASAGPHDSAVLVRIPPGAGSARIAQILEQKGVVPASWQFRLASRWTGHHRDLQAGEYKIPPGASLRTILDKLGRGERYARYWTLPEGYSIFEAVHSLNAAPALRGTVSVIPPEGSLLPQTYRYEWGDRREEKMNRARRAMDEILETLWAQRQPGLPYETPQEALVMASIIEKETGLKEERAKVAGVFVNRLRRNMRLQSDPTVIYAMTKGRKDLGRPLTRADLKIDSPYNTYQYSGLPPAPICNPGEAAIRAALAPARHEYLYFVADSGGGHAFARDLAEHNRNVAAWRRSR